MNKFNFIKDSLFNANVNIVDETNRQTDENYRICHNLNQSSGFVNFKTSNSPLSLYCITDQNNTIPQTIYTQASVLSGFLYDFDLTVSINNIDILSETVIQSGPYDFVDGAYQKTVSGFFTPTQGQLNRLLENKLDVKNNIKQDITKITVTPSNSASNLEHKLRTLDIYYTGNEYSSYNSLTPDIYSFYPSSLDGNNFSNSALTENSDASFVSGPTTSPGNDSTWITNDSNTSLLQSGYLYNQAYIDFYFNTSGIFNQNNNTRKIDKCIFSIRANNSSGNITNNQDWCTLGLFVDEFEENIGFGSGFHINNKGGFTKLESNISFLKNDLPNDYFATSDLMDEFFIRLYQPPKDTKISSAQIDFYFSNDDMLCFSIPAKVGYKTDNLNPYPLYTYNTGKNRISRSEYCNNLFNIVYKNLDPDESISSNFTPVFGNYYNERINTYEFSNHYYNNYVFLQKSDCFIENINTNNDYTIMLHCSTSGNFNYLKSDNGATLLEKKTGSNSNFKLVIQDNKINCLAYDSSLVPHFGSFDSYHNMTILITNKNNGIFDDFNIYTSNNNSFFTNVFSLNTQINDGVGGLYIGGSGINDFTGYIHEYGISYNHLTSSGVQDFYDSRYNISKVLSTSGFLELEAKNLNEALYDNFQLYLELMSFKDRLYHNHPSIFAYNTLLTSPESYIINLEYELTTTNASGLNFSGYYLESAAEDGIGGNLLFNSLEFQTVLSNGSNTVAIQPFKYADSLIKPNIDYLYIPPTINFYLESLENSNDDFNLKIKDVSVSFGAWYTTQTGVNNFTLYTNGYVYEYDNLDFYLHNPKSSGNSNLDFYIRGRDANTNYINFYSIASEPEFNSVPLISSGNYVAYDGINLLIDGLTPQSSFGELNFYTSPSSYDEDIYYDEWGFPYYYGDLTNNLYSTFDFTILSDLDYNNSINLYIGSSSEENEDSINFYTFNDSVAYSSLRMYMPNNQFHSRYQLDFFVNSVYNQSGNINMFTEGA